MYESDDPRSRLSTKGAGAGSVAAFGASSYGRFYADPPQESSDLAQTWYMRGQNFVVCYSEAGPGASFERAEQADEYVLLLHDPEVSATIEWNGTTTEVPGYTIAMIPAGASRVTCNGTGRIVRLITSRNPDVVALARNNHAYPGNHPQIPEFEPWPEPVGGWKVRTYSLDVPDEEGRFGKIFRCTTFMVNVFPPQGPRDLTKLSPHQHDDFEQCSLALQGWYMHHLRWPWTANQYDWRDDEHERCNTPSVCVIPPKVIHTSAPSGERDNVLVDIFAPPREDFSDMPGWVINADDYPRK